MRYSRRKLRIFCIMVFGFFSFLIQSHLISSQREVIPFVIGVFEGPSTIDPINATSPYSTNPIMQTCEGLYRYDYSSEMEPIPCLAAEKGEWNPACTEFTVNLKQGVTFHNGTPFNANSAKWVFDRLQYFTSGIWNNGSFLKHPDDLPTKDLFFVNGQPILNCSEILSTYQIRFFLNFPYAPFESLLANTACAIHLPDFNCVWGTNFFNLLDLNDELIGTGPFVWTEYILNNEVVLDYYREYHLPWIRENIEQMIYLIIPDPITMSLAGLNHELHWFYVLPQYYPQFTADPDLTEIQIKKSGVYYIQMNTDDIPFDVRQASQWCWNHSYLHTQIFNESKYQLKVPIPVGMMYHHSNFLGEPSMNIEVAREFILNTEDPGLALNVTLSGLNSSSANTNWNSIAESTSPLAWYNFTVYNSSTVQSIAQHLKENLKSIGIKLNLLETIEWEDYERDFVQNLTGYQKMAYSLGYWEPTLYDPISMIESLYQTDGKNNAFLLTDTSFDTMLNLSYQVSDMNDRGSLFGLMQQYFVKNIVPSFYIAQEGDIIRFNSRYVYEDTIGEMLSSKGDHYWFNVGFFHSYRNVLDLDMNVIYILSSIIAGFTGLIIIFTFLEKCIVERRQICHSCGKLQRKRKNEIYCPFCGVQKSKTEIKKDEEKGK